MSSIDELRTSTEYTGNGTASGTEDGNVLMLDNPNIKRKRNIKQQIPQNGLLNLGSVNKPSVGNDEFTPSKRNRSIADLSTLPEKELLGVDIKESIEEEVFKPGGDFDVARNAKMKEFQEVSDLIDQHNAQVAANLGIDVPSDEELQKIGQEDMTPAIIGTKYYDQSDGFGRSRGKVKTSPLEEKAAKEGKTIDQYVSGQSNPEAKTVTLEDGTVIKPTTNDDNSEELTNLNFDEKEEEYMDALEKEINEELTEGAGETKIIDVTAPQEDNLLPEEDVVDSSEDVLLEEPVFEVEDEKTEEVSEPVEEKVVEPVKEEPKVELASPTKLEEEKKLTTSDLIIDAAKNIDTNINTDLTIDDEDIKDIEEGTDSSATADVEVIGDEENVKLLQAAISEKIKPVSDRFNISTIKVVNSPISLSAAIMESQKAAMSWVLPNSGQYIAMREFTGKEIEKLGDTSGTNRFETMKNRYKLFYDHIVSPKPATFEQWVKTVSFLDNDHLYFAVYGANFAGSNFIPYDCPKCKKTFLSNNIPLESMYKFKDDKAKERITKIISKRESNPAGLYVSEIVPISENFAVEFKDPSIYNMVFETSLIDDRFAEKYRDVIAIVSYIQNIYYINKETNQMQPIGYKVDNNNMAKTLKAKIITYAKILSKLTPDQYYVILAYLNSINSRTDELTYVKPEVTCDNCHTVIEEEPVSAESLVFTRAQLASLAATSINS